MNVEELKLVTEMLSKVTDGALTGAIVYFGLNFIQSLVPWVFGCFLVQKIVQCIPKIKIQQK